MSYEECHIYRHPITSDAGRRERIEFLFTLVAGQKGVGERKTRAMFRRAGSGNSATLQRQYDYTVLLMRLDAMEPPRTAYRLAVEIAKERWKRPSPGQIDALRKMIERAIRARESGKWKPRFIAGATMMITAR